MTKLVWRVKLVAEVQPGVVAETELARIERDEEAGLADFGLRLAEAKQLTAALQAEIVPAQLAVVGKLGRCCSSCGRQEPAGGDHRADRVRAGWTNSDSKEIEEAGPWWR